MEVAGCTFKPLRGNRYRVVPNGPVLKKAQLERYRVELFNRNRPPVPPLVPVRREQPFRPIPAVTRPVQPYERMLWPLLRQPNAGIAADIEIPEMASSFKCPVCQDGISFLTEEGTVDCLCGAVITVTRSRPRQRARWYEEGRW